jgi:serine protease Do
MKKIFPSLPLIVLTLLAFFSVQDRALAQNNIEFLNKDLMQQLNHAIYEVVTPKLESSKIVYDRELPFDKLSFRERNERYHSIGTAFFINEKELMTAAHVLNPIYFSLQKDFFIRDSEGKVYPIHTIRRYSTIRDMLVFDLGEYPEQARAITFAQAALEVGDTVFSAGNALGEGISYRAGQVASFTEEPEFGKWRDIRFSSPASPGNSGGPLLNLAGEVTGLIVRRANLGENYNSAVPISELEKLGESADFFLRNLTVEVVGTDESIVRDWSYTLPLPAPLSEVAEQAQNSLEGFYRRIRAELTEQVQEKNFPRGSTFRSYLRNQAVFQGFASMSPSVDFKKWNAISYPMERLPLSPEQNVFRGGSLHFGFQALIEKEQEIELKQFITSPKLIMDTLLKAVPYYRYVGAERVRITSFGEPEKKILWQDKLGRPWTSSLWYAEHGNYLITSHCLPHPKGVLCKVDGKSADVLKLDYWENIKEACDEIAVGYTGELKDWIEYLALDKDHLPRTFHKAHLSLEEDQLTITLPDFRLAFRNARLSPSSSLHLTLGYANAELLEEALVRFGLFPQKGNEAHYRIQPFFAPDPLSQDSYITFWDEIVKAKGTFSGQVIHREGQHMIRKTVLDTLKSSLFQDEEITSVFTVGCFYRDTDMENEEAAADCQLFSDGIEFTHP